MAFYLISYDLKHAASHNYNEVHEKIKSFGSWAHVLESTWLVDTTFTAATMVSALRSVYAPENCFVVEIKKPTDYQGYLSNELWAWINARLR